MLVLSRNVGESIVIGEDVVVTVWGHGVRGHVRVLMVSGATVRLGIEAPRDIVVHRSEVVSARAVGAAGTASPEGSQRADAAEQRP